MGMPKTAKRLHKETNQDLIDDEVEAIDGYDKAISESDNPEAIATYEHIKGEEEEHIEELEGLDKMKADDITSEQAWEDFKAGYSDFKEKHVKSVAKDREGDNASLEEKIDVLSAKISELNTDMSRLTDSVPQALGTIEEGKTIEEEAEDEQEEETLEGEVADEEGGLFDDDDGLDDIFGNDETGEEGDADADGLDQALGDDGEPTDEDNEGIDEGEEVVEDDADDVSDESDEDADSDEDFIPIDDVMNDEESSEDEGTEETEDEDTETEESEDEDEKEEIIDKMVHILEKMDKRITHLERENAGLKKMLSQKNTTVQTEPRNVAKSRPTPNTNLRLVKGSYNRPPVSTQYVANQRDIGIGKKTDNTTDTPVFRQGLNEVFENCERIANQNHF